MRREHSEHVWCPEPTSWQLAWHKDVEMPFCLTLRCVILRRLLQRELCNLLERDQLELGDSVPALGSR